MLQIANLCVLKIIYLNNFNLECLFEFLQCFSVAISLAVKVSLSIVWGHVFSATHLSSLKFYCSLMLYGSCSIHLILTS